MDGMCSRRGPSVRDRRAASSGLELCGIFCVHRLRLAALVNLLLAVAAAAYTLVVAWVWSLNFMTDHYVPWVNCQTSATTNIMGVVSSGGPASASQTIDFRIRWSGVSIPV